MIELVCLAQDACLADVCTGLFNTHFCCILTLLSLKKIWLIFEVFL